MIGLNPLSVERNQDEYQIAMAFDCSSCDLSMSTTKSQLDELKEIFVLLFHFPGTGVRTITVLSEVNLR